MNKNRKSTWYSWLKPGDIVVAVIIIVLAAVLFAVLPRQTGQPASAEMIQNGEVIRTWTAAELNTGGEARFESNGYHYLIEWQDGGIHFAEADCPDQVCVHTGWLNQPGRIAACAPGGLIIKTLGQDSSGTDVDVVMQ